MGDAGEVLFGPIGREVLGIAQLLFLVFIMGSHVLTFGIMMNTLSNHGTCTIVFNVVGMIVSIIFTLPRTLKNVSWLSLSCRFAMRIIIIDLTDSHKHSLAFWPHF